MSSRALPTRTPARPLPARSRIDRKCGACAQYGEERIQRAAGSAASFAQVALLPPAATPAAAGADLVEVSEPEDASEREADRMAAQALAEAAGAPVAPSAGRRPQLARMMDEEAAPAAAGGFVVDDDAATLLPGQLRKGPFLRALRAAACAAADRELARAGRDTDGCPYLQRWFDFYEQRDARHVERALRKYAPEAAHATAAADYIPIVSARAAQAARRWAETGALPDGMGAEMMGGGLLGAIGAIGGAIGGALSAIGSLFFKAEPGGARGGVDRAALEARLGTGQPLDARAQARMGAAFGHDFSRVRVHADHGAAATAAALSARAFTLGDHVAFAAGHYRPGDLVGDALLAHELAHVVQQGAGSATAARHAPVEVAPGDTPLESEADHAAEEVVTSLWSASRRRTSLPRRTAGLRLQRCSEKQPTAAARQAPREKRTTTKPTEAAQDVANQPGQDSAPAPQQAAAFDAWLTALPFAKVRDDARPGKRVEGSFEGQGTNRTFVAKGPLTEFRWDATIDVSTWDPRSPTPTPGFRYREEQGTRLAAELPATPERAAAAHAVAEARKRISARFFVPRNQQLKGVGQIRGLEWSGQADVVNKLKASGRSREIELYEQYREWLKRTMANKAAGKPDSGTRLTDPGAVNKVMRAGAGAEGEPSSINAWDRANVTWGAGITGALFPRLLLSVMNKSPEARHAFIAAGITVLPESSGNTLVVADPEQQWSLRGVDAELYLRARPELLSLFVNIAQGVATSIDEPANDAMRLAVLDAQLEIIQGAAAGSSRVTWASESARLMAFHSVWGGGTWDVFVKKQAALGGKALTETDVTDALSGTTSPEMRKHMQTQ